MKVPKTAVSLVDLTVVLMAENLVRSKVVMTVDKMVEKKVGNLVLMKEMTTVGMKDVL
jgi:hypothetical protein